MLVNRDADNWLASIRKIGCVFIQGILLFLARLKA
jgi:hypothetical protein